MAVQIREILANRNNYGTVRNEIKYIVIHYTANDGDTAERNGLYFKNNTIGTSAHYFVDDKEVVRSVPDSYVAYSVGGKNYGGRLNGAAMNYNTLNVELCDTIKNGTVSPTKATVENALEFVKSKMKEYNIPKDRVIRHYDVTKKSCPAYWVNDARWKAEFWNLLDGYTPIKYTPITPEERAVYRVYNRHSGEHLFSADANEVNNLLSLGWDFEGIAWKFPEGATTPVYRLYNPYAGDHFFTTNDIERTILAAHGWKDEGIAFPAGGPGSVFRMYDGEVRHFFTTAKVECESLKSAGWKDEGTAWSCE